MVGLGRLPTDFAGLTLHPAGNDGVADGGTGSLANNRVGVTLKVPASLGGDLLGVPLAVA